MKSNTPPKFRHELKFLISEQEKELIEKRLELFMKRDAHVKDGCYTIRSLYFDDIWQSAYEEKMAGTSSRKKYRIRIYNNSDEVIHLERKRKEGQYIQKTSAKLTKEETKRLIAGDFSFLAKREEPLCQDFYREWLMNRMYPAVVVDYERVPFVYPYGDVRITFDMRVRAGLFTNNLFDAALPVAEVMEPGKLIMEVKFTEYLPELIRDVLPVADSAYMAYSKYTMCLEKKKELSGVTE